MEKMRNCKTRFQQSDDPIYSAKGCGFFGSTETMNLCSKCYRDHRIKEEQTSSVIDTVDVENSLSKLSLSSKETVAEVVAVSKKAANRCECCNKKVGLLGFMCKRGSTFCGSHRYAEEHNCTFGYKLAGKEALAKANPRVVPDKLHRF